MRFHRIIYSHFMKLKIIKGILKDQFTGIAPTTLYSIIQRDTSVRFDHALRIANILGIDITQICKENPYDEGEVLPQPLSDLNGLITNLNKQTYIKNRTTPLLMLFDNEKCRN